MIDYKHNAREWTRVWSRCKKSLDPPPKLLPSEWNDTFRYLSKEANASGGKFKCLPFQREPMDSAIDPDVISTTLMWASQVTGKTEVMNSLVGYFMHQDPAPMMMIQPNEKPMAEAWSKDRLATMIRDTPVLTELVNPARTRDSGNTIKHKIFPGGHITVGGANAPSGLASRPIRIVFGDELDRWPPSAGEEGDPLSLAVVRTTSFWNACCFKTSTPTVKGISRIEREYEQTDKRNWFVNCPTCKHEFTLMWKDLQCRKKGKPETAMIRCPGCGKMHDDAARIKMVINGKWKATAPFTGHRGYWLNGLNCLFPAQKGYENRLHQALATFIDAKHKGKETLKVFINTFLAESWEDSAVQVPADKVLNRRETINIKQLPKGIVILTCGVDVQDDRLEAEIVGYGIGEESWGVEFRQFVGDPAKRQVWAALDTFLCGTYHREDGLEMKLSSTCIDTGGHNTKAVYAFVKPRQHKRVYAVKGSSVAGAPLVARPKKSGVEEVKLLMIGTDTAKEMIYGNLSIDEPGAGYTHIPDRYTDEWCHQLVSERIITEFKNGQDRKKFVKPQGARNEALDIRVYSYAAFSLLGYNMEKLSELLNAKASEVKEELPQKQPRNRSGTNWVTTW